MTTTFQAGTGMLGSTAPGQKVTHDNVAELPPGSVVRLADGSRIIHLHDETWLWCCDHAHLYDKIERFSWRLDDGAELCHMPRSTC